jgi:MUN domain
VSVLEATLSKLSRYDEGSLIGSILSFTVSPSHLITLTLFTFLSLLHALLSQSIAKGQPQCGKSSFFRSESDLVARTSTYSTLFFMGNRQNVSGSGKEMGQAFVSFERNNVDQIRSKVNDELWILNFFEVRSIKDLSYGLW